MHILSILKLPTHECHRAYNNGLIFCKKLSMGFLQLLSKICFLLLFLKSNRVLRHHLYQLHDLKSSSVLRTDLPEHSCRYRSTSTVIYSLPCVVRPLLYLKKTINAHLGQAALN